MNWIFRRFLLWSLILCQGASGTASAASPLLTPRESVDSNVKEYFSSNREKRFLIRVHIWGDIPLQGIHYLPDNTTLLDALGFAGGPNGILKKTDIVISRLVEKKGGKESESTIEVAGDELVSNPEMRDLLLRNGDVIHLDSPPKVDTFMRTLGVVSTSLSIITAILSIYLVTR